MANKTRTLEPGTLVDGRYKIVDRIGRGGFATVYRSQHIQLDRPAALKILDPITSGTTDNFIQRFLSEARIVANLRHPNVVMIYDFGVVSEDQPYIAMDLLEGHDLETELMNHGPIRPERAKKLFLGVLDALDAGHQKQIVHKDLKPSNLFLVHPRTDREKLIVLDYGIARVADSDSPRLTQTGGYTGTPAYMPPEYIRESIVSPTNDVYQIGLILIEVMTGEAVINEKTSVACMVAHLGGKRNIPGWVSESPWGPVLKKALEIEHKDRFQSAGEFMAALDSGHIPDSPRKHTENEQVGLVDSSSAMLGSAANTGNVGNYTPYPAIVKPVVSTANGVGKNSGSVNQGMLPQGLADEPSKVDTAPLPSYTPKEQSPPTPAYTPKVQHSASTQPDVLNPSKNPTQTTAPRNESALDSYARMEARPKKKSKLLWILFFIFVGIPMGILAIFLAVIYGYYGGFTEYGEALNYAITGPESSTHIQVKTSKDPQSKNPTNILSNFLNNQPKSDVSKIHSYMSARYMAYNLHHQLEMFDVSVQNYGYEKKDNLIIPTGGNDLLNLAVNMVNQGSEIQGGPKNLKSKASAFLETVKSYRLLLEDLTDYYNLEQGYLTDNGAKGKKLHTQLKRANKDLMKSYRSFGKTIKIYYKATFDRCVEEYTSSDSFEKSACQLMLEAWELNHAISSKTGEKRAIKRYQTALLKLKKAERANRSRLESKNSFSQHTSFIGSAEDYLSESRNWVKRRPPHKWKNRIPLPEAPLFVHMDLNFLLMAYKNMNQ